MPFDLKPRGNPIALTVHQDMATILQVHPEAFDCLVYAAQPGTQEVIAQGPDVVGSVESRDRACTYAEPVQARAMIAYDPNLSFGILDNAQQENFYGHSGTVNLVLSLTVERYSLIRWLEYATADGEQIAERTVYINDIQPGGRNLGAINVYSCYPMSALEEVPEDTPPEEELPGPGAGDEGGEETPPTQDMVGVL